MSNGKPLIRKNPKSQASSIILLLVLGLLSACNGNDIVAERFGPQDLGGLLVSGIELGGASLYAGQVSSISFTAEPADEDAVLLDQVICVEMKPVPSGSKSEGDSTQLTCFTIEALGESLDGVLSYESFTWRFQEAFFDFDPESDFRKLSVKATFQVPTWMPAGKYRVDLVLNGDTAHPATGVEFKVTEPDGPDVFLSSVTPGTYSLELTGDQPSDTLNVKQQPHAMANVGVANTGLALDSTTDVGFALRVDGSLYDVKVLETQDDGGQFLRDTWEVRPLGQDDFHGGSVSLFFPEETYLALQALEPDTTVYCIVTLNPDGNQASAVSSNGVTAEIPLQYLGNTQNGCKEPSDFLPTDWECIYDAGFEQKAGELPGVLNMNLGMAPNRMGLHKEKPDAVPDALWLQGHAEFTLTCSLIETTFSLVYSDACLCYDLDHAQECKTRCNYAGPDECGEELLGVLHVEAKLAGKDLFQPIDLSFCRSYTYDFNLYSREWNNEFFSFRVVTPIGIAIGVNLGGTGKVGMGGTTGIELSRTAAPPGQTGQMQLQLGLKTGPQAQYNAWAEVGAGIVVLEIGAGVNAKIIGGDVSFVTDFRAWPNLGVGALHSELPVHLSTLDGEIYAYVFVILGKFKSTILDWNGFHWYFQLGTYDAIFGETNKLFIPAQLQPNHGCPDHMIDVNLADKSRAQNSALSPSGAVWYLGNGMANTCTYWNGDFPFEDDNYTFTTKDVTAVYLKNQVTGEVTRVIEHPCDGTPQFTPVQLQKGRYIVQVQSNGCCPRGCGAPDGIHAYWEPSSVSKGEASLGFFYPLPKATEKNAPVCIEPVKGDGLFVVKGEAPEGCRQELFNRDGNTGWSARLKTLNPTKMPIPGNTKDTKWGAVALSDDPELEIEKQVGYVNKRKIGDNAYAYHVPPASMPPKKYDYFYTDYSTSGGSDGFLAVRFLPQEAFLISGSYTISHRLNSFSPMEFTEVFFQEIQKATSGEDGVKGGLNWAFPVGADDEIRKFPNSGFQLGEVAAEGLFAFEVSCRDAPCENYRHFVVGTTDRKAELSIDFNPVGAIGSGHWRRPPLVYNRIIRMTPGEAAKYIPGWTAPDRHHDAYIPYEGLFPSTKIRDRTHYVRLDVSAGGIPFDENTDEGVVRRNPVRLRWYDAHPHEENEKYFYPKDQIECSLPTESRCINPEYPSWAHPRLVMFDASTSDQKTGNLSPALKGLSQCEEYMALREPYFYCFDVFGFPEYGHPHGFTNEVSVLMETDIPGPNSAELRPFLVLGDSNGQVRTFVDSLELSRFPDPYGNEADVITPDRFLSLFSAGLSQGLWESNTGERSDLLNRRLRLTIAYAPPVGTYGYNAQPIDFSYRWETLSPEIPYQYVIMVLDRQGQNALVDKDTGTERMGLRGTFTLEAGTPGTTGPYYSLPLQLRKQMEAQGVTWKTDHADTSMCQVYVLASFPVGEDLFENPRDLDAFCVPPCLDSLVTLQGQDGSVDVIGDFGLDACMNNQCGFAKDLSSLTTTPVAIQAPRSATYRAMNRFLLRIYGQGDQDQCIRRPDELFHENADFEIRTRWVNPRDMSECLGY